VLCGACISAELYSKLVILAYCKEAPTFGDLMQLLHNGDYVGYQSGSFVYATLKRLKFDAQKIKVLFLKTSPEGGAPHLNDFPLIPASRWMEGAVHLSLLHTDT
jgi:hypothetical protein